MTLEFVSEIPRNPGDIVLGLKTTPESVSDMPLGQKLGLLNRKIAICLQNGPKKEGGYATP